MKRLAIPLLSALLVGLPVLWAWPEELSFWRSLGIVLGWTGCGLLLASLLLMVREPRLADALGGLERMYRWHHGLGTLGYLALALHPLALAADYLNDSPALAWATLWPADQGWPLWFGWLGLILLMLGTGLAHSRLAYGRWRLLHLLLVPAIGFGFAHLILLGLSEPIGFSMLLAALLLLWRFLRADLRLAARPYLVSQVQRIAQDIVELDLRPLATPIAATPGQFVMLSLGAGSDFRGCGEAHPFTISGIDAAGQLRLAIKALGDCTRHMQTVRIGTPARVEGPYGHFLAAEGSRQQFWLAGGIGITPFLASLRDKAPTMPTTLLYCYRSDDDAAYVGELRAMAETMPQLTLHCHADNGQATSLDQLLPTGEALANCQCYLCGPPGMIEAARCLLTERGVPSAHIRFEAFDFR